MKITDILKGLGKYALYLIAIMAVIFWPLYYFPTITLTIIFGVYLTNGWLKIMAKEQIKSLDVQEEEQTENPE